MMQTVAQMISAPAISKSPSSLSPRAGGTLSSHEQYRTLLEVGEAITSQRDLPGLFRDLSTCLHRVVRFDYLGLSLHDRGSDALRLQLLEPPDPSIPLGLQLSEDDAATWVWRNQQPVILSDLVEAERWPGYHEWAQRCSMNSLCVLPL